jgi:hypothetical protein
MMNVSEQVTLTNQNEMDSSSTVNPALPVFVAVMTVFLNQLEALDQKVTKKLRQSILSQVSLRLSSLAERQKLNAWLTGSADKLDINIGLVDMQHCLHHTYHSACVYFGPTEADVLLAKAVSETETLPIATEFSPQKLF